MRISTIAWANLRRRKSRAALLVAGIAIGIATAVALLTLSRSIGEEIGLQLDQYGANIVVVPKSDQLALDYGGVAVAAASFDVGELTDEDARRIREIPYANRLAVVAPKLLGAADVEGKKVVVAGVDFESEYALKRWWRVVGGRPRGAHCPGRAPLPPPAGPPRLKRPRLPRGGRAHADGRARGRARLR